MSAAATGEGFAASREHFETLAGWLAGDDAAGLTHSELEVQLDARGHELLRGLFQDHLGGRPKARRMLTDMTPTQQRLYEPFDLDRYAPTT